jgi:signal transduction histidine kinase
MEMRHTLQPTASLKVPPITMLVVFVGFAASFGTYFAARFPLLSLVIGLTATLIAAWVLGVAAGRRDAVLELVEAELEAKNTAVDAALWRQAETEQSILQAHRMEAVGQLAGGIAHDFNNLLQAILSYSEFLSEGLAPDSVMQQDVAEVQKAATRAAELTRQLQLFSHQQTSAPVVLNLNTPVRGAEGLLRYTLGRGRDLRIAMAPEPCYTVADPGELEMLLLNLVLNARDAMGEQGEVIIAADTAPASEVLAHGLAAGAYVRLRVTDDGMGMAPEVAARAFEPFFTTKETGRGVGLGLSMVHGIADRAEGATFLTSSPGQGTTVTVLFPAVAADLDAEVDDFPFGLHRGPNPEPAPAA